MRYSVDNLHCGGCVSRAEAALSAIPGVAAAQVNLVTKRAEVTRGRGFDADAVRVAMARAGYPVTPLDAPRVLRFAVDNLSCGSCVSRAETALSAVPGVETAQVNLASRRAEVTGSDDLDIAQLRARMQAAGYPLTPLDSVTAPTPQGGDDARPYNRAFLVALALTLPVFISEMGGHIIPAFHRWQMDTLGMTPLRVVQFLLTTAVLIGPGHVFFQRGVPALLRGAPEMNSLVVLGAGTAWAWSSLVTFAPGLVPETGRHVYFEAAAVIVTLILLGRWLEARARGAAGAAIEGLMALTPDTALRVSPDGTEVEVPMEHVQPGDVLRLRPGARVAVDGVVLSGASHVDEAMLTGEPLPVAKGQGDPVTAGTINGNGLLAYRATAVGGDTVLARIVAMVEDAQATRLPIQSLINRVTGVFVPIVLVIASVAALAWSVLAGDVAQAVVVAVSVLIIACPCAMGLATPVSVLVGTGRAAELGVLFRRGDALQGLSRVDLVAFDKTGTLTEGKPAVTGIHPSRDISAEDLLRLAAALERGSEHPLARAIVAEAGSRGLHAPDVEGFESHPGAGVIATLDGETLRLGSRAFLSSQGVAVPDDVAPGATQVHLARGALYLGCLALSDPLKPDAETAVANLMARGVEVAVLSGDGTGPVAAVAERLGVTTYRAECTPADKRAALEHWRARGLKVAFVGDGINDAPVLAAADVGIALGTGTDIAMEAAQVVLASGAPSGVVAAFEVSRRTMRNIAQNLFWAFGYNVALIPVAAGVLALFGGPFLNPMLAAGAMAASSVLVVGNAVRLRRMEVRP
ncbi:heavy metal translocating P-type ATPase [Roseicyclus elongatus]|nr:heavy metal translocating P-type ATPase [Roseibacterium elongatum]